MTVVYHVSGENLSDEAGGSVYDDVISPIAHSLVSPLGGIFLC